MSLIISDWKNVNVKIPAGTVTTVYSATLSSPTACWWFIDTSVQMSNSSTSTYPSWYILEIHMRESPEAAYSATQIFPNRSFTSRVALTTLMYLNANQIIDIRIRSECVRTCEYALFRATRMFI